MKFQRKMLENGAKGWVYETGEHKFTIAPVYAPNNPPNHRGYIVYHTGPRPELKSLRERDNVPLDDDELVLKLEPVPTLKLVKAQMTLLLKAMEDATN
jgi:hypothetical protein